MLEVLPGLLQIMAPLILFITIKAAISMLFTWWMSPSVEAVRVLQERNCGEASKVCYDTWLDLITWKVVSVRTKT